MVEQAKVRERSGHFRGRAGVVIQEFGAGDLFRGSIMRQAARRRLPFEPQESYMLMEVCRQILWTRPNFPCKNPSVRPPAPSVVAPRGTGQTGVLRMLGGAFHLAQPLETVFLQALPATLFMRLASPSAPIGRLSLLFMAVIAIYGAVGALNDYCDYSLDLPAKPRNPRWARLSPAT